MAHSDFYLHGGFFFSARVFFPRPLIEEKTFVNNVRRGPYKTYYPNGKPRESGTYHNGKEVGVWLRFDKDGNMIEELYDPIESAK
jgi:hypothetical protein